MANRHQKYYKDLDVLVAKQGVSHRVANDVLYLRKQSVHTAELEQRFIAEAKAGAVPDVTQFGK